MKFKRGRRETLYWKTVWLPSCITSNSEPENKPHCCIHIKFENKWTIIKFTKYNFKNYIYDAWFWPGKYRQLLGWITNLPRIFYPSRAQHHVSLKTCRFKISNTQMKICNTFFLLFFHSLACAVEFPRSVQI